MNTYKFNAAKHLHDNKSDRQAGMIKSVCRSRPLDNIGHVWPIEAKESGDHMGPGGYDSRISLSNFKNWSIPLSMSQNLRPFTNENTTATEEKAITKEAETSRVPFCELALPFPFGVIRRMGTNENPLQVAPQRRVAVRKSTRPVKVSKKRAAEEDLPASLDTEEAPVPIKKPRRITPAIGLKQQKAKYLLEKAATSVRQAALAKQRHPMDDRRAKWNSEEDEVILVTKCAQLYFLPDERSVPFKIIADVSNEIIKPLEGLEKKVRIFN